MKFTEYRSRFSGADSLLGRDNLSAAPAATRLRTRRLTEDGYADHINDLQKRTRARGNHRAAVARAEGLAGRGTLGLVSALGAPRRGPGRPNAAVSIFRSRTEFHLSRGRTPEDIVIREGWGAPYLPAVRAIAEQFKAGKANA